MRLYKCNMKIRSICFGKNRRIKEIDSLGRMQIPKDIRKSHSLGKQVELVVTKDGLLIKSVGYKLIKVELEQNK